MRVCEGELDGPVRAPPSRPCELQEFAKVCAEAKSMRRCGCLLAWLCVQAETYETEVGVLTLLSCILPAVGAGDTAVHRSRKGALPLRLGELHVLHARLNRCNFEEVLTAEFSAEFSLECWTLLSLLYVNWMHGCRAAPKGRWRKSDLTAVSTLRASVQRVLQGDADFERSAASVEKELSSRFVSYSGEEVPKMEVLTYDQVAPALPPRGHGGSIPVVDWTKGRTRSFLLKPHECIVSDEGQSLPKLQAKVHIENKDREKLAHLLVERQICDWVDFDEVLEYRGEKVLNGLFGVAKTSALDDGRAHLRLIMNLIPSNSVMLQLSGCVQDLPSVTQYISVVLEEEESLRLCQSDMTSAFYLFSLPSEWKRFLAFDLVLPGEKLGKQRGSRYALCCRVLPMGWASAVSVMQEVSQQLLDAHGLPGHLQVRRTRPLPNWLTQALSQSKETSRAWYHVYLDNFFSGEKVPQGGEGEDGKRLHAEAEAAWASAGVVSSEKKRVVGAECVQELGALLDGKSRLLGAAGGRLQKLIQSTCLVLSKRVMPRKWVQVILGRWVHVLQFRRAGMAGLHWVWKYTSNRALSPKQLVQVRRELCMLMAGSCLFHTFLGAGVSGVTTASDASGRGGAVGKSTWLSPVGQDFCRSLSVSSSGCRKVPILVISLFNGIGGAFRAYDLLGVEPMGLIGYDISKPASRVCSRRWPHAILGGDVREITKEKVFEWFLKFPHVEQVDLWGGFPCVDLSAVRYGRKNLDGPQSGLFREILRVLELLRQVYGRRFRIFFFVENVSSMDKEACQEISDALGVEPYKVQCADAVPISRPRYCWTNKELPPLPGVSLKHKDGYCEVTAKASYPLNCDWIREDSWWDPEIDDVVFPTAMKAIPRKEPPPRPAGLSRTPSDGVARWESDSYRYPPYQYKAQYLIWSEKGWRLLEASEREILHGYGYGHTSVCMSASDIKRDPQAYEDTRCSLVGDSFSMFSFALFSWSSCFPFLPEFSYSHLAARMGMAPGFCAAIEMRCPITRSLSYGAPVGAPETIATLTRTLLTRVNHTGSDIRVSSGQVMNPKAYPRQSCCADWWEWEHVFHCRWNKTEHINRLELRSILLALRWRVQRLGAVNSRFVHLTDSYVCMSVVSKGRSSSDVIMSIMRQIAALQLSFNLYPILVHVESTENPTDEASRR